MYFKVSVQYGTVILSLYFPYQNYERIQLAIPCFYERAFSDFSCLELHDFTPFKTDFFSGEDPKTPTPRHMNNIKTTMSSVYLCREVTKKTCSNEINLHVNH